MVLESKPPSVLIHPKSYYVANMMHIIYNRRALFLGSAGPSGFSILLCSLDGNEVLRSLVRKKIPSFDPHKASYMVAQKASFVGINSIFKGTVSNLAGFDIPEQLTTAQ